MVIDLVLALAICFLVCLAYRIEPGFIPPSGWFVSLLMTAATLLTFCLLGDIFRRILAYETVEVTLMVVWYIALGAYGLYSLQKYLQKRHLENKLHPRKKITWIGVTMWAVLVLGIIGAAVATVVLGIVAFE